MPAPSRHTARDTTRDTTRHTSRLASRWAGDAAAAPWRTLDGTAVLADLSGFTRLTEVLTGTGAEGVEVLHQVLTLTFGALLGPSLELGGDVLGFAGDAALVWFDGEDHLRRAAEAATTMPSGLAALPAASTGGARLRVSVGIHSGTFTMVLAGTRQRGLFVCGPAASAVVALQSAARPGQVLMSHEAAARLPPAWRGNEHPAGIELRRRRRAVVATGSDGTAAAADEGSAASDRSLLSAAVWELLRSSDTTGDHRAASIGFVELRGVEGLLADGGPAGLHRILEDVTDTVVDVCAQLGVQWLDVDVGVDSVKLVLAAGAPLAVDSDEERMLLALRRILDDCPVAVRAGAQRGRVFCAPLGLPSRRTYTVIGDPVNVAARALGAAGDRELVVGDGLDVAARPHVDALALGLISLRNRAQPMPMWRVDAVRHAAVPRATALAPVETVRAAAWTQLITAWKRTIDADGADGAFGGEVVVVGDPGMGASSLLASIADRAGASATLVVAHPFLAFAPYATILDVARSLAASVTAEPVDDPMAWLFSFAARLPAEHLAWVDDVRSTVDGRSPGTTRDPLNTAMRARVVLAALLRAAAPRPWLLAIDDVDRIDEASRAVLRDLAGATAGERVLFVTSRAPGGIDTPDVTDATIVVLDPLDDERSTELVIELAPMLRDDQVARVVRAGRGNPFVLAELSRAPSDGELPDSLHRLSAMLIDALPVPQRELVRAASAFGAEVDLHRIAMVLGEPELADPAAWAATFPVLALGSDRTVAFRHDALRVAAHDSMTFRRRRALHAAIATHLAAADGNDAALAFHYEQAGMPSDAFSTARTAGLGAKATGAMREACELLGQAVRLARRVAPESTGILQLERGEALAALGDLDGAAAAYAAAARGLPDPLDHARLCHQRASLALTRSEFAGALPWIRKGLAVATPLGDAAAAQVCRLLLDRAGVLDLSGRHEASLTPATEALALGRRAHDRTLEGLAHLHLGMALVAMMRPDAFDHVEAAVDIFDSIGHERYLHSALNNSGLVAMYFGRWDDAIGRYERAAAHADRCGNIGDRAIIEMNIGFLRFRQGHLADAAVHARRSMRTFDTVGVPSQRAIVRYLSSEIAAACGAFDDAAATMATAREIFVALADAAMVVDCDVTSMAQLVAAGRHDDARALVATIEPALAAAEVPVAIAFERNLGQLDALLGDPRGAERIRRAAARAREHSLPYDEHLCLRVLLDLDRVLSLDVGGAAVDLDEARRECDAIARRLGLVPSAAG